MKNNKTFNLDYLKANRKGSRDAELENSTGFVSKHKTHKSKKNYTRKLKHKGISKEVSFFFV
jgi:hypothetical protein